MPEAGLSVNFPRSVSASARLDRASTPARAANSRAQQVNSDIGDLRCASRWFISRSPHWDSVGMAVGMGYAAGPGTRWVPGRCAVRGGDQRSAWKAWAPQSAPRVPKP
ncbi:hypothetical protein GCM10017589_04140 [Streptomyces poonensis]|nr:hypothetical protein GCM10017589_04140 [Streptomyces poonensis]